LTAPTSYQSISAARTRTPLTIPAHRIRP
jgi:hypothetical protein